MPTKITVPELGESIVEATLVRWLKHEGDPVEIGEALAELETDKVDVEIGAEQGGVLVEIQRQEGEDVKVGDVLGVIDEAAQGQAQVQPEAQAEPEPARSDSRQAAAEQQPAPQGNHGESQPAPGTRATPVAQRMAQEQGIDLAEVQGSGAGRRITREDLEAYQARRAEAQPAARPEPPQPALAPQSELAGERAEKRIPMTRRRRTIARRLVEAQRTAAMLTTFNEIDMGALLDVRRRHNPSFEERHGTRLGIVSFFVKACIGALKAFPRLNAEIQDDDIVLKHYFDIGVAIGAEDGLVVPVLRDADHLSFADIERRIAAFIQRTREGTLSLEDIRGGTFTITNGGVFGSLLSTPILNPPQVGILGLHKFEDRPVAVDGQIALRPMMYVALSYDHRIVDGREAVQFLVRVKELIEDPERLFLDS